MIVKSQNTVKLWEELYSREHQSDDLPVATRFLNILLKHQSVHGVYAINQLLHTRIQHFELAGIYVKTCDFGIV
ncbi:hypothetical protein CPTSV76_149 [Enterobacteria phage SV76]|nr:hypothetical protein CPTSV76_149 [Enterobacteria phage SV76]